MMPLWRPETPHGGDLSGHDEYAMWDAAYVLGSLSSAERRELEAHLAGCPLCRSAIGELNGMPALLSQLDRDELAAIDEADRSSVEPLLPDELLPSLLAKVSWRRRRSRIVTWTAGAAAAAVLAIGVLVGVAGHSRHPCPRRRRRACRFSRWRRSGRTGWPRRSRSAASSGERSSR